MRRLVRKFGLCGMVLLLALGMGNPAHAEDIVSVLERSQQQRLNGIPLADADSAAARQVRASFENLLRSLPELGPNDAHPVELRISHGLGGLAETLRGDVVVANDLLAALPETERLFILAHELGHVSLEHWSQMGLLFQKWVPGEVMQAHTDAVAALLGQDAAGLSHQQEFEADAFAMRLLHKLGHTPQEVLAVFTRQGLGGDTATHPSTRKRIGALLALRLDDEEDGRQQAARQPDTDAKRHSESAVQRTAALNPAAR